MTAPANLMSCPVCAADSPKWIDLDHLRTRDPWIEQERIGLDDPLGFCLCGHCGFLTYKRETWATPEGLARYYAGGPSYRSIVSSSNHTTCNRKNLYHKRFLAGWLEAHGKIKMDPLTLDVTHGCWDGASAPRVYDYGCAQGAMLQMLRDECQVPNGHLYGKESTPGFVEFGRKELGLNLFTNDSADLAPYAGKPFDLISLYHVLEHLGDPAGELLRLKGMLAPGGAFYISIPHWLNRLEISDGTVCNDWETLFHPNHINCFSINSFTNLLARCGLVITQEDRSIYGYTVLAEPAAPGLPALPSLNPENPGAVVKVLELQKQAIAYLKDPKHGKSQPGEAVSLWPDFPDAQIGLAYHNETMRSEAAQKKVLDGALTACPGDAKLVRQRALSELQWAENRMKGEPAYNNGIRAFERFMEDARALRPHVESDYHYLGLVEYLYKGNPDAACAYWRRAARINPNQFGTYWTYIGCARAGKQLPKQEKQQGNVDQAVTSKVQMTLVPEMAHMRPNLGVMPEGA